MCNPFLAVFLDQNLNSDFLEIISKEPKGIPIHSLLLATLY